MGGIIINLWKKGAIIGGIWGLLSIIPYSHISSYDTLSQKIFLTLIGFPTFIALLIGFHFLFVFIGSPIIGIIIGTGISYLIEKRVYIMKYLNILMVVGIICFSNIIIADAAIDNGTLNINLDNNTPLLYNAKSIQITIVNVENKFEKIFWKDEVSLPFNRSFSVYPGIYKVYIQKGNFTVIEFNNDNIGYTITSQSNIDIPAIRLSAMYTNTPLKDILSDIPWRINRGENIPITYIIKDANEWSAYFRTITVYNDGDPVGSEAGDILVFTHPLWRTFAGDFWYDHDILSPSLFNQQNNSIKIHIKFDIALEFDVHNFYTTYVSPYDFPHLENWSYGDTHYHSSYTDNVLEFGAPIRSTKVAGKAIGLDWATITDHSFDLDLNRWNNLVNDSSNFSTIDFQILPSEEISCTVPGGLYQKYNHYLAYGITGFIPGGEWEDGTGSHYSCDELVYIVNAQGGFGHPAHPTNNDLFIDTWRNYSLNFSGLEIWNGAGNPGKLEEGLNKWKELLLNGRKIFIEAGSDAHGDFNSGFGKVRTAVFTPYISNNGILLALREGHSIMTDGPIVEFDINGTIIGDTIVIPKGNNINLNIRWNSTPEFGNVYNITVIKGIIGNNETIEQEIYPYSYSGTRQIIFTAIQDGYFRLMAFTSDGYRVYTNPIWIKIPPTIPTISFDKTKVDLSPQFTGTLNLTLDSAPAGLSGYNLTISLSNTSVATLLSAEFPGWANLRSNSSLPGGSVWIKAADINELISSGANNVLLATLTIRGDAPGKANLLISVSGMDDDNGTQINPATVASQVEVSAVVPFPCEVCKMPTDPDGDGLYEDINGNGRKDFNDVVVFFNYLEWVTGNQPISSFDFNGNGRIDFNDIIKLFEEL